MEPQHYPGIPDPACDADAADADAPPRASEPPMEYRRTTWGEVVAVPPALRPAPGAGQLARVSVAQNRALW